ncbi:MAG: radical SAM protein [Syntrophomonas sp.]
MTNRLKNLVDKAMSRRHLEAAEIKELLSYPLLSEENFFIQFSARRMNEDCGKAEVHGQIGVNTSACPCNCAFCSFAAANKIFTGQHIQNIDDIIEQCKIMESAGANAIYLMATANLDFQAFLSIGSEVYKKLDESTILIANIGDFQYQEALALKEAGFKGIYHALRLGEGQVTRIAPEKRLATMQAARKAGLQLGTCLEPVGPEHTLDEMVEKIIITRESGAVFSGAARRIPIPGTELEKVGKVSEARMAQILAVVRLATGHSVPGNCTHEPNVCGVVAGANLLWAEVGSNPRDTFSNTQNNRGFDVLRCREILEEAEVEVLDGPSRFFGR